VGEGRVGVGLDSDVRLEVCPVGVRGEVLPSGQRAAGSGVPRAGVDNCLATRQEARRQDGGR